MADLHELRARLHDVSRRHDDAIREHVRADQRLRLLEREALRAGRRVDERRAADTRRRDELAEEIAETRGQVAELRAQRQARLEELAGITALLEPVTDPRDAIRALDARFPILLFPVRLETRFVTVAERGRDVRQLLVRVYPDECQVDAFEPELSDGEVQNLRRYWCGLWSAGGVEGMQRAVWRELCAAHGAGRAMYLCRQYAPLAGSDAVPARANSAEIILAVPVDTPIGAANERNAIATYWTAVWRAENDAVAAALAYDALRTSLGDARAAEVDRDVVPFNVKERPEPGVDRATAQVSLVFVVLPPAAAAATKRVAWTRPPKAALLPERFVLFADSGDEHVEQLGGVITQPLVVGPDPLAPAAGQFSAVTGDLVVPAALKWMTDFETARAAGMGFRINLTARQAAQGFERLYVVGVHLAADEERGREGLEALILDQARAQSGFAIVPQGTATNNTEHGSSGWTRAQEADELFDVARLARIGQRQFDPDATAPYAKKDGLALAEALGIDASVMQEIPNADGTDQAEARAMNAALWPATLGYWMDTQMNPVFGEEAIERTRRHFMNRVSGRGTIPAIRVGKQPYGILATTAFSRIGWFDNDGGGPQKGHRAFLTRLYTLLTRLAENHWDDMVNAVPFLGKPTDVPQQQLLDVLGLNPSSVEFHLNVVDSAERIWNRQKFIENKSRDALRAAMTAEMDRGMDVLRALGYDGEAPEIVAKFFSHVHGPMDRPTIDVVPVSETAELSLCTVDDRNYIGWCLAKAALFDDLRQQKGFAPGKTPNALLYHMLRHALQLGFHRAAVDLHSANALISAEERLRAYHEPAFVHIAAPQVGRVTESRYRYLYARPEAITGNQARTVAEFIPDWVAGAGNDTSLADQLTALSVLEHADTASLERAFSEHIDLCSYRWDAWLLSLVNDRLHELRRPNGSDAERRLGIHVGAFGWMENLRPDAAPAPVGPLPADLREVFQRNGDAPLARAADNGGHVLAPSLNHAVTAAVLRSGYLGNAAPAAPDAFAVDVSSSRVRVALQFIEGVRNGQSLGALLGYQFERRLHDRHAEAEMDALIYEVRRAFPLASKRITDSVPPEADDAPIEQVEARNVCDGLLLLEHVRTSSGKSYPWSKDLADATDEQVRIIDEEVQALFAIHDAIADVSIAEGVHQVLAGNVERGTAAMDALSKGGFPTEPDVVRTPRSGSSITHRVALHLAADAAVPLNATPRAATEPALDAWLASVLPPLAQVFVRVVARNSPPGSNAVNIDLDIASLGLRPIDLLHLLDPGNEQAMNELDDRILKAVLTANGLCPDAAVTVAYAQPIANGITLFEVGALIATLRTLVIDARPLKPSDAALPAEGNAAADARLTVPATQLAAARAGLIKVQTDATALLGALSPIALPTALVGAVVAGADAAIDDFVALQFQAGLCGVALSGAGAALRARREWFELVRRTADSVAGRWQDRLTASDAARAIGVNPANSDLMRIEALLQAEREISTVLTTPIPNTPPPMLAIVNAKRAAFDAARVAVVAVKNSAVTTIAALWAAWAATFPGRAAIDLTSEDMAGEEAQLRLILADMEKQTRGLLAEVGKRIKQGDDLTTEAGAAAGERRATLMIDAVKAYLGDAMRVVPRFTIPSTQGTEWQNAFDDRAALVAHLAAAHPFPVDDWMHGVARVRGKVAALENVVLSAGAFATTEPVLIPVQFPYRAGAPWLAMELPPAFDLASAGDHLLYTASYPGGAFDRTAAAFCGLLLDEWTEVVPAAAETAGVAFHYDRPSHEPPQAMLLVTPATVGDAWQWEDLRAAIPETFALAKRRAVEPRQVADRSIARFLPATLMAFTTGGVSISSELRRADVAIAAQLVQNG